MADAPLLALWRCHAAITGTLCMRSACCLAAGIAIWGTLCLCVVRGGAACGCVLRQMDANAACLRR